MSSVPSDALRSLSRRSVEIIARHQHVGGAYPASPTFPVYRFSWFRDGAFIADAMSRAGERRSAERFFDWCAGVVLGRADHVHRLVERARRGEPVARDEHLPTRYTLDGRETGEDWWDFQLDGYGTWIWALVEHHRRQGTPVPDTASVTGRAVATCVEYLCTFWDEPCFDWWEEFADGVHPSTLASIHAGLSSALGAGLVPADAVAEVEVVTGRIVAAVLERGVVDGHLVKTFDARGADRARVDASLIACATPFGMIDPRSDLAEATYESIVNDLAPDGVHRYVGDTFYGGGRWVLLAGFLGAHEVATGRHDVARRRLEWMWHQRTPDDLLPEQVTAQSFDPSWIGVWEAKWGPVATPLLWSHAMYLTLADALGLLADGAVDG